MQPPRRVSVDVSAAARFALLYFFLPLEASAHTYLQRLPACVLGGRSALICRRADPPGYQTPAQKKVRLSPPSQLAAVPARPLAGVPPPPPWNNQRGRAVCLLRPCKSRGRCRTRTLPTTRRVAYEYIFLRSPVRLRGEVVMTVLVRRVRCCAANTNKKKVQTNRNTVRVFRNHPPCFSDPV